MAELYLGIDLGGSHISSWALDRYGKTYNPFSKMGVNRELPAEKLVEEMCGFIQRRAICNQTITAVGLAGPGPLDPNKGVIISPPNLPNIKNLEIVRVLQDRTGLPVFLVNDADAAVLSEHWLGSAKGFKNVVMLTLGTGVGSGVITNWRLQRGKGMAAEWGHTSIYDLDDRTCSCGRMNCLEAFCGTEGLAKTYCNVFGVRREDLSSEFVQEISMQMRKHLSINKKWKELLDRYCLNLTEGILNIVNVHQPDCIVLGGGIANEAIVEKVRAILQSEEEYRLKPLLEGLEIRVASNQQSGVIGAAKYALDCHDAEIEKHRMEHGIVS